MQNMLHIGCTDTFVSNLMYSTDFLIKIGLNLVDIDRQTVIVLINHNISIFCQPLECFSILERLNEAEVPFHLRPCSSFTVKLYSEQPYRNLYWSMRFQADVTTSLRCSLLVGKVLLTEIIVFSEQEQKLVSSGWHASDQWSITRYKRG